MSRKLSRETRQQVAQVKAAGGSVRYTRDGHVVFLDRAGEVVGRSAATKGKGGRASRNITAAMVAKVGPPPRPKPRPVHTGPVLDLSSTPRVLDLTTPAGPEPVGATSPTQEGHPMEKTILVCDGCEAAGQVVGAADTIRLESNLTGRRAKLDLCAEHVEALWSTGTVVPIRSRAAAANGNGHRGQTFAPTMRCPLPGDDGYEGPGQGMFQHYRHHHDGVPFDDVQKDAARMAFQAAHANGRARAKVAS